MVLRSLLLMPKKSGVLLLKKKVKVNHTALDFTVPTGRADLRLLALQPGSAMGGWGVLLLERFDNLKHLFTISWREKHGSGILARMY